MTQQIRLLPYGYAVVVADARCPEYLWSTSLTRCEMNPQPNAPDIALVGAMKSATTSLAALMAQSQGICLARHKEPGFFSRDERWQRGMNWYEGHFAHRTGPQLRLDASTCYTRSKKYPEALERLYRTAPHALVVYMLRHPVQRAYSHYYHEMVRRYLRKLPVVTMREFFTEDLEGVSASFYDEELQRIYALFPKNRVCIIRFENFSKAPIDCVNQLLRRCGVDELPATSDDAPRNTRQASGMNLCRARLLENALGSPGMRTVRGILPARANRTLHFSLGTMIRVLGLDSRMMARFEKLLDHPNEEMDRWLHTTLDPHTKKLEELLGWDLSTWVLDYSRMTPSTINGASN